MRWRRIWEYGKAWFAGRPWGPWLDRANRAVSLSPVERLSSNYSPIWTADLDDPILRNYNAHKAAQRIYDHNHCFHIKWLIPDVSAGSGGHRTIFRFVNHLAERGIKNSIYVIPKSCHGNRLKEYIHKNFGEIKAEFFSSQENIGSCDVLFATSWETAYTVYQIDGPLLKAYFIQDYEADFYPAGSFRQFAVNTYSMNLFGCCASTWLARKMHDYGMEAVGFDLGVDYLEYYQDPDLVRDPLGIAVYIRPETERRGLELLIGALQQIKMYCPEAKIRIFGSNILLHHRLPFKVENFGLLSVDGLRSLYCRSTLLILTSFTNYSLLHQEAMACGCIPIDLNIENVNCVFGETGPVVLANPNACDIAEKSIEILKDDMIQNLYKLKGQEYIKYKNWNTIFDVLQQKILAKWDNINE